jgi:hypothetical protein
VVAVAVVIATVDTQELQVVAVVAALDMLLE